MLSSYHEAMSDSQDATQTTHSQDTAKSNVPEFSVSEIAGGIKRTLEDNYNYVRVRGELSRITVARSGHMYSDLKDDKAVLSAVCWKNKLPTLSIKPEEGMEVIATGKISTFPGSSKYQIIIDRMELAGEGALLKMLEERRKKLAAEGLFAEDRKKKLPLLPEVIGVVTSPTGAVIRDIIHRLEDRFPRHVILWPVLVQGEGAADQITAAIRGFENVEQHGIPKPDLLIVGRGGGSLEDLMAFNEENVVRAIADSTIPVISAVGHETDNTLADLVADLRAPTPTGAAEKAVPVRRDLLAWITECEQRMLAGTNRRLNEHQAKLETLSAKLGDPVRLLESQTQRLDLADEKLTGSFSRFLDIKRRPFIETAAGLRHPKNLIRDAGQSLNRWSEQLTNIGPKITQTQEKTLDHMGKMLEAYSFENVLQRGFSVVRDESGTLISTAGSIKNNQILDIQFKDRKHVTAIANTNKKPSPKKKKSASPNDQQTLFD